MTKLVVKLKVPWLELMWVTGRALAAQVSTCTVDYPSVSICISSVPICALSHSTRHIIHPTTTSYCDHTPWPSPTSNIRYASITITSEFNIVFYLKRIYFYVHYTLFVLYIGMYQKRVTSSVHKWRTNFELVPQALTKLCHLPSLQAIPFTLHSPVVTRLLSRHLNNLFLWPHPLILPLQ